MQQLKYSFPKILYLNLNCMHHAMILGRHKCFDYLLPVTVSNVIPLFPVPALFVAEH